MLEEKFTNELMIFTVKSLKLHKIKPYQNLTPISLAWIKKVSSLISKGSYNYSNRSLLVKKNFCYIIFIRVSIK